LDEEFPFTPKAKGTERSEDFQVKANWNRRTEEKEQKEKNLLSSQNCMNSLIRLSHARISLVALARANDRQAMHNVTLWRIA